MTRLAAVFWLLLPVAATAAQLNDRTLTEAMAARAGERLRALHSEADELAAQARTLLNDLRKLELQRQIHAEELRKADAEATAAAADLAALDEEVQTLEAQERAARPELEARLVELYKLGEGRYVRLLLSTTDARQVGRASRIVATLAKRDRDRIAEQQERLEALSASRAALEERATRLAALRAEAARAKAAGDRAVREHNALIREIDSRRDLNAQLAGELEAAQQALQARVRDTAAAPAAALPLAPFRGGLDWPVSGPVARRSGAAGSTANGIVIGGAEGTPVRAVHDGTVAFAGPFQGFGLLVIVDHGSQSFSLYGQLAETDLARGARVARGDRIGAVGLSVAGDSGLYFELRVDGKPVDPLQWLAKR